jgi:hypothetical protein
MSHGTEFLFWGTIWACILYGVGGVSKKGTILFVLLDRHVSGYYGLFARLFYSPIVRRMKTTLLIQPYDLPVTDNCITFMIV